MSESGIDLTSPKDISISADQSVSISAKAGITIDAAESNVSVSGGQISQSAKETYSAEGKMEASINGGEMLTMKATMVMIN